LIPSVRSVAAAALVVGLGAAVLLPIVPAEDADPARRVTFVVSGELRGRLEPCGCAKELLGGLPRRMTYVERLRATGAPVVLVSAGDLTEDTDRQAEIKSEVALDLLGAMSYAAVGTGAGECALGAARFADAATARGVPPVSANVAAPRLGTVETLTVDTSGGAVSVSVTSLVDPDVAGSVPDAPTPLLEALPAAVRALNEAGGYRVLVLRASLERARSMDKPIREAGGVDLVVAGDGEDLGAFDAEPLGGGRLVTYGTLGKRVGRVDVDLGADGRPVRTAFSLVATLARSTCHRSRWMMQVSSSFPMRVV